MTTQLIINHRTEKVRVFVENLNGIPLEMLLIPSGIFMMGALETEEHSDERDRPQHGVSISQFFMGRYPITQAQWRAIASQTDLKVAKDLKLNPSYFKGENRPVEQVSWQDAIEFCARLSRHTNKNYRLPSEAEWEYACRAGTTTPFHFGETISTKIANYHGNYVYGRGEKGEYRRETTDVTLFKVANAFGLSEMHGNVWEWCLDPWHENYNGAPKDGRVWDDNNDNRYQNILHNANVLNKDRRSHIVRGGSWSDDPRRCRSAYRSRNDFLHDFIGFRVVCAPQ